MWFLTSSSNQGGIILDFTNRVFGFTSLCILHLKIVVNSETIASQSLDTMTEFQFILEVESENNHKNQDGSFQSACVFRSFVQQMSDSDQ